MTTDANAAGPPNRTHKDYYTALYHAALTISSSLELNQVLQSVVTSITEAMQVKACALRLLDPATGQLQLSAVHGLSSDYLAKGPVEVERSPIGVMRVYTDTPTTFHEDDVQFLSVLASLAALAIENARLYESIKSSYDGVVEAFWGWNTQAISST